MPVREYVTLDQLLPLVLPDCPNVPRGLAMSHIRKAAIRFCIDSRFWREEIVAINTVASQPEYEVFCQAPEARVVVVLSLQVDGRPVTPRIEEEMDREVPRWRTATGRPAQFITPSESWVRLTPIPIEAHALTGRAVMAPTATGNYLLKDLFNNHADTLASLAKATLLKMPDKPWSNPAMADYEERAGRSGIDTAKSQASRNFAAAPKRRTKPVWL